MQKEDALSSRQASPLEDRIEGDTIYLDGTGKFPKRIVFNLRYCLKQYKIIKGKRDSFELGK